MTASSSTQTKSDGGPGKAGIVGGPTPAPECPERYTRTQAVLHGMFMEDAGGHILDSGDAYGRLGDEYRKRPDRLAMPEVAAYSDDDDDEKEEGEGDVTDDTASTLAVRSTFHALDASLEYSAELDAKFDRFCAANDDGRMNWTELAERFAAEKDAGFSLDTNMYNTYYFDNPLDAQFQWLEFDTFVSDDETADKRRECRAVMVQLHIGCDIRGGYGRPRVFVMRSGDRLKSGMRSFVAACKCTEIECFDGGIVHNEAASSECEACAFGGDQECNGPRPDGCICGEYPTYWKASGRPDGSIRCAECGKGVEVS